MKLGFIGIGKVGFALANNLQKKGHEVLIAHDNANSESVKEALKANAAFQVLPVQEAVNKSEVIFLAIPFKLNQQILQPLRFKNKVLVDCTNPVGPGISHGLDSKISGAEKVQEWAKDAIVVKSYSIYGYENLQDPHFPNYHVKPVMMIAGNDKSAKGVLRKLNDDLGFDTLDVGNLSQALHLEHLTLLWVKMVRVDGHQPHLTWTFLER